MLRRRFVQVVLMAAGLMAGWVASAGADLPPPPITLPTTITLPTVTLPTVTVPPPPAPVPPVPPVPPAPPLPPAPPAPTLPGVTLPTSHPPSLPGGSSDGSSGSSGSGGSAGGSGGAGTGGGAAQGSSSGAAQQSRRGSASSTRVHRLHLARDWISVRGPKGKRRTTLVFVLRRPALVQFVVVQVSPNCRRVGQFRVRGHRGLNRVRLHNRVGRRVLAPGTYRIVARTLPSGRVLSDTRLVVVERGSRRQIRAARSANACPRGAVLRAATAGGSSTGGLDAPKARRSAAAGSDKASQPARHRGVLGARFTKRAIEAAKAVPLWLYLLAGLAIALLAAGAFLPKAGPRGLVASIAFGLTGAVIMLVATIAYALL